MIERVIIRNYKCIKSADIKFNKVKNIIVGNNGVGKSTLIEAISLALGYGINKFELTPNIFNIECVEEFKKSKILPEIIIDIVISGQIDEFSGTNNILHEHLRGLQLKISFDESFRDLYKIEEKSCNQIPCEFYKIERNWFSDNPVKQLLIPLSVNIIDSSSSYFNSYSSQYINNLLCKYIGDEDLVSIKTSLRHLKEHFDDIDEIKIVNEKIDAKRKDLKLSIDVTSRIDKRDIVNPIIKDIPITQLGAGELCILKTILSLDKTCNRSKGNRVIIIEEPESHLSHTKMYELINQIQENMDLDSDQLIITTHNSFIANKLDLGNLLLLDNKQYDLKSYQLTNDNDIFRFFTKVCNYPTLRLLLCKSAILCEGPTDEMVITYCYKKKYDKHPFDDNIELISVNGTGFKEYCRLACLLNKRIAVVTDNDKMSSIEQIIQKRGLNFQCNNNMKIFAEENPLYHTLEPSFVYKNISLVQALSDIVRVQKVTNDNAEELSSFMEKNKTDWAFRLLDNIENSDFHAPEYIQESLDWVRDEK